MTTAAWLGCNAILGNESAVFAPESSDGGADTSTAEGSSGGGVDATPEDARQEKDGATTCTDTLYDQKNCGACGHDCLGGECKGGACQPVELAEEDGPLEAIAVSGEWVYWSNIDPGVIKRVRVTDKTIETVYDGTPGVTGRKFGIHDGKIYFVTNGANALVICPVAGCAGATVRIDAGVDVPNFVDIVDDTVLVTSFDGHVEKCSPPCETGLTSIAEGEVRPIYATRDATTVAWSTLAGGAEPGEVRVKIGDLPTFTARTDIAPWALTFVGDEIVYADLGGGIKAMQRDGGGFRSISRGGTRSVAVDSSGVYFSSTGAIHRCPVSGCIDGGPPLASGQALPDNVAIDDKSVYWLNAQSGLSSVRRLAK